MTDKRLGYALMLLSLILAFGVGYFMWLVYMSPHETRTLRFPQVGSLYAEDPVRMEGTLVGEITGFDHDDSGRVLVYIKSKEPIPIRTSSYVAVKVKGVMGERFIEISTGNPSDPLIPKDVIVDGQFEMGPSEAIVHMDRLEEKIVELMDIMLWLRDGRDDGKRPFIVAFNDIAGTVDTLVYDLLTWLVGMEDKIGAGVDTALVIANKAIILTADAARIAPKLLNDLDGIITKLDGFASKVDTVMVKLEPIVAKLDTNEVLWKDYTDLDKLRGQLSTVRDYIELIREEGLPLTVKPRLFKTRNGKNNENH